MPIEWQKLLHSSSFEISPFCGTVYRTPSRSDALQSNVRNGSRLSIDSWMRNGGRGSSSDDFGRRSEDETTKLWRRDSSKFSDGMARRSKRRLRRLRRVLAEGCNLCLVMPPLKKDRSENLKAEASPGGL